MNLFKVLNGYRLTGTTSVPKNSTLNLESGSTFKVGGTAVTSDAAELNILDGMLATTAEINRACDVSTRLVDLTAATLSLTVASHEGKTVTVNRAAGSTITLPASAGTGAIFRIVIGTTLTSGSLVIQVANASDVMQGQIFVRSDDAGDLAKAFAAGATSDTITLNRTTTGVAAKGEWFELQDVATNLWQVVGMTSATGTEATPFSAAV